MQTVCETILFFINWNVTERHGGYEDRKIDQKFKINLQ